MKPWSDCEADRASFIVGIGGGIVCDVTGYAASTYLRGLKFGFVASTLLAQVDAAVGGKNGVNWEGYKNMIGVFNQPDFVICDPLLLRTLPRREVLSGMAEVVKHALIADAGLFSYLEENGSGVLDLRPEVMERLVCDSVRIKSSIVNRDEREKGERRLLNFGHTFGHALEKVPPAFPMGRRSVPAWCWRRRFPNKKAIWRVRTGKGLKSCSPTWGCRCNFPARKRSCWRP